MADAVAASPSLANRWAMRAGRRPSRARAASGDTLRCPRCRRQQRAPPRPPPASRRSRSRCASPTTAWSPSSRRGASSSSTPPAWRRTGRSCSPRSTASTYSAGWSEPDEGDRLVALNDGYAPIVLAAGLAAVRGVVVQRAGARRKISQAVRLTDRRPHDHHPRRPRAEARVRRAARAPVRQRRPRSSRCTSLRAPARPRDAHGSRTAGRASSFPSSGVTFTRWWRNSVSPPGPSTSFKYQIATNWRWLSSWLPPSMCQ